jgi:hypothetical protein
VTSESGSNLVIQVLQSYEEASGNRLITLFTPQAISWYAHNKQFFSEAPQALRSQSNRRPGVLQSKKEIEVVIKTCTMPSSLAQDQMASPPL